MCRRHFIIDLVIVLTITSCSAYRPVSTPHDQILTNEVVFLLKDGKKYRLKNITDQAEYYQADAYFNTPSDKVQKNKSIHIFSHKFTVKQKLTKGLQVYIPKNSIYQCHLLVYDKDYRKKLHITAITTAGIIFLTSLLLLFITGFNGGFDMN